MNCRRCGSELKRSYDGRRWCCRVCGWREEIEEAPTTRPADATVRAAASWDAEALGTDAWWEAVEASIRRRDLELRARARRLLQAG